VCSRYENFFKFLDTNQLSTEAVTFGLEYKSWLVLPVTEAEILRTIQQARFVASKELFGAINFFSMSIYFFRLDLTSQIKQLQSYNYFCKSSPKNTPLLANQQQQRDIFNSSGVADVALILDPSYYSQEDFAYQFQVSSSLVIITSVQGKTSISLMTFRLILFRLLRFPYYDCLPNTSLPTVPPP